jgi:hypothetical protein
LRGAGGFGFGLQSSVTLGGTGAPGETDAAGGLAVPASGGAGVTPGLGGAGAADCATAGSDGRVVLTPTVS